MLKRTARWFMEENRRIVDGSNLKIAPGLATVEPSDRRRIADECWKRVRRERPTWLRLVNLSYLGLFSGLLGGAALILLLSEPPITLWNVDVTILVGGLGVPLAGLLGGQVGLVPFKVFVYPHFRTLVREALASEASG